MTGAQLRARLAAGERLLMDGGMGSEIEHRGYPTTLPLWSAEALLAQPEVVLRIHQDYIEAGADILVTNTFRTTRRAFARRGIAEKAASAAALACSLARRAREDAPAAREIFLAGSLAPLEDCYSPELTPLQSAVEAEHAEIMDQFQREGLDFMLLETMITERETLSGASAAHKSDLPFAVSFCCNAQLALLSGEPLQEVVGALEAFHPLFVGINCVSTEIASKAVRHLREITSLPLSVYAQGESLAEGEAGWKRADTEHLRSYMQAAPTWLAAGAQILGGCCGTTPTYIRELRGLLAKSGKISYLSRR